MFKKYGASFVITLAALLTTGCSGQKVSMGDYDKPKYPIATSTPNQVLKISGELPSHIHPRLRATWSTTTDKPECRYYENIYLRFEGVPFRYAVSEDLNLIRSGNRYEAGVVIDRFQKGACGWDFVSVSYMVPTADHLETPWNVVIRKTEKTNSNTRMTIWCPEKIPEKDQYLFCSYWNEALRGKPQLPEITFTNTISDAIIDFKVH